MKYLKNNREIIFDEHRPNENTFNQSEVDLKFIIKI